MGPVPVVDLASPAALDEAASSRGMFILVGHEVSDTVIGSAHDAVRRVFAVPATRRRAVAGTGYRGMGDEALDRYRTGTTAGDRKESFTARFDGTAVPWPDPEVERSLRAYHAAMTAVAARLLAACERILGARLFRADASASTVLRALHYPAAGARDKRAGAHTDFGAVTILSSSGDTPGLQVYAGRWRPVAAPAGSLIVNFGEIIARWTNDRWAAPLHRVAGTGGDRYTLAWFTAPPRDTVVAPLPALVPSGSAPRYSPVSVGDLLSGRATAQRA